MEGKNKNKGLKIIIVILVIVVLGLGGYITYDKVLKKYSEVKEPSNTNKQEESKKEEEVKEEVKEEITFDKAEVNKWLENFSMQLMYGFGVNVENETHIDYNKIKVNDNLLKNINDKFCFAWTNVVFDKNLEYTDIDASGSGVTGAYTYKYNDVNNVYKNMYGEEMVKVNYSCSDELFTLKDDLVYGHYWTGWTGEQDVAKANKLVKENDLYTLSIDMLYDYSAENGFENLLKYQPNTVTEYDESIIVAKFEMTLEKDGNNYNLKELRRVA